MSSFAGKVWESVKSKNQNQIIELLKTAPSNNFDVTKEICPETKRLLPQEVACSGLLDVIKFIVSDLNYNVNFQQPATQVTILHMACRDGHLNIVNYLVDRGADVNITDREKYTALHYAVGGNYASIVSVLVGVTGIKVNEKDFLCRTPLMRAVEACNFDIIKSLIERGKANVNMVNESNGWTCLHYASYAGFQGLFNLLLKYLIF